MEILTAVNRILPVLGEHPVTSLDTKHPTLAVVIAKLGMKVDDIITQGYWFNTSAITLYPDSEGGIALPTNTLSFVPDRGYPAVARGSKLYNIETASFLWSTTVTGKRIERLAFNELPEACAQLVMYATMVTSYVTDIGLENDVQVWQGEAQAAERRLMSEHLRNMRYSTASGARFQRIKRAMVS